MDIKAIMLSSDYLRNNFNSAMFPDYISSYDTLEGTQEIQNITIDSFYRKLKIRFIEEQDITILLKKIELDMNDFCEKVSNEKIMDIYEIGDLLNQTCKESVLLKKRKLMNLVIPFETYDSEESIKNMFLKLINEQDVFRTSIYLDGADYKFAEHNHINHINLNILDL